jgi:parallel beta-helix repeat protein
LDAGTGTKRQASSKVFNELTTEMMEIKEETKEGKMQSQRLLLAFALGLGLTLALLNLLNGPSPARASPGTPRYVATTGTDDWSPLIPNDCTISITPCLTVQRAVDAADPGDEILVATGVYTDVQSHGGSDQAIYVNKTLRIRGGYSADFSTWNPDAHPTTLDAGGKGRVAFLYSGTDPVYITPTLEGLRLTNGSYGLSTGGIYARYAHLTISGCHVFSNSHGGIALVAGTNAVLVGNKVYSNTHNRGIYLTESHSATVTGNEVYGNGGNGVYLVDSYDVTLTGNQVYANTESGVNGGGVYVDHCPGATLTGNEVYSNTTTQNGGGFFIQNSDAILAGNRIYSNTADQHGGGAYLILSSSDDAVVTGNEIYSNAASQNGGGICLFGGNSASLRGNTISNNTAAADGGGVCLSISSASLSGNVIRGNTSQNGVGSGMAMFHGAPIFTNTVIADNVGQSSLLRAAIYIRGSSPHFTHLTLARHVYDGLYVADYVGQPSTVFMTNTIIYSHTFGVVVYNSGNRACLQTTLFHSTTTPFNGVSGGVILESDSLTGDPAFLADGYHLGPGSAAIDQALDAGVATDLDGDPRPIGPLADLGADEAPRWVFLPLVLRSS